jgi:hypothetical protein
LFFLERQVEAGGEGFEHFWVMVDSRR